MLTEKDYNNAAKELNVSVAVVKAIAYVESRGKGFLPNGWPKILFERHIFSRRTSGRYDLSHPHISNRRPGGYGKVSEQHQRLQEAVKLDRDAALKSASWGRFQIMGFNYKLAGFNSLQGFINAMYESEGEHLLAFVNFIKATGLADELQRQDWAGFAQGYNGRNYWKNKYDIRLKKAYEKYSN